MISDPKKLKGYRHYKPHLREEFQYACVYCELREPEGGGASNFEIDHYRPKSIFPHLETKYENLLYACGKCNRHKGGHWSIFKRFTVLNPRVDDIVSHINVSLCEWKAKTERGKWNFDKLRLSSPENVKRREKRKKLEGAMNSLEALKEQIIGTDLESIEKRKELEEQILIIASCFIGKLD